MIVFTRLRSADLVVDIDLTAQPFTTVPDLNTMRGRVEGKQQVNLPRSGAWPVYTGQTRDGREFNVQHQVEDAALEDSLQLLEGTIYSQRYGELIVTFSEEGVDKEARVTPLTLAAQSDNNAGGCADLGLYTGVWFLYDQTYYAADSVDTGPVTTAGDSTTVSVDVAGTVHSERVIATLSPTGQKAAADGQQWRIQYTVVNRVPRPVVAHPVEITDQSIGAASSNGLDTSALLGVPAGDDAETYCNLRRIPRWAFPTARTWGDTDTGIVPNLSLPPRRRWTVDAAIGGAAVAVTVRERDDLTSLPPVPFYVARITSMAQDVAKVTAVNTLTGVLTIERDQRGTTGAAWAAGEYLYWAPREGFVDLVGGWTAAPVPSQSDDEKPCILDVGGLSSNAEWVWAVYYETGIGGDTQRRKARSAGWFSRALGTYEREKKTGDGDQYWRYIPVSGGDPATAFGLEYQKNGAIAGRPLMERWDWINPIGFDSVAFDITVALDYSGNEARVVAYVYDEDGNEIVLDRYDNGTFTGEGFTLGAPGLGLSFRVEPYDAKTDGFANDIALEPADGTGFSVTNVAVDFNSDQQIVSIAGTQQDVYQFGRPTAPASLQNGDGDTLYLYGILCPIDGELVIDVEAQSVTVDGEPASHLVEGVYPALPPRLDLYPTAGATALVYAETDATGVEITVTHRNCWN